MARFNSVTGRQAAEKKSMQRPEYRALVEAQRITARQAWRILIADPTDENRAVFVIACERAR